MSDTVWIAGAVLLSCMFLKIPVFASLLLGSLSYFILTPDASFNIIAQRITTGVESVPLLAIPFYICAGVVMNHCGITERIMNFCGILTGRLPGGLAQVNILLSTLMGGLSGSSIADAAMEAKMLVPEMEKHGMPKDFSTVVTAFSSIVTPMIPPGIQMIIYGSLAGISIGKLFVSGVSVGLFTCLTLMVGTAVISKKRKYPAMRTTKVNTRDVWEAFKRAALPLALPIIIIGGIRIGAVTPTEAGAVAVVYGVLLGIYYKKLTWDKAAETFRETIIATGSIILIVASASVFAWVLTKEQVPQTLSQAMASGISSKIVFLLIVNLFLLIVGMFIEGTAVTIVLTPIIAPIAASYGIDPIHFAFIFIFNLSIGCLTPPMGTLMFVTCGVTGCKTKDFIRAGIPYFIMLLIALVLVTFVPVITIGILDIVY